MTESLPLLLGAATLAPLAAFFVNLLWGNQLRRAAAYVSVAAILTAAVCSFVSLTIWFGAHPPLAAHHGGDHGEAHGDAHGEAGHGEAGHGEAGHGEAGHGAADHGEAGHGEAGHGEAGHGEAGHGEAGHGASLGEADSLHFVALRADEAAGGAAADAGHHEGEHSSHGKPYIAGTYYLLGKFNDLTLEIGYYIDSLTVCMFAMVTLIASCIHFYAMGYMHDEEHDITDHEVTLSNGHHLRRPGRFHRFFQALSLFCFSMLGLVLAGNIAMVFVFWELVGICSYFLIGFYVERKSASTAANKAFIVNRVGDFGMIIGLMAIWSTVGTFTFGDTIGPDGQQQVGLFSQLRPGPDHALQVPSEMVRFSARERVGEVVAGLGAGATAEQIDAALSAHDAEWRAAPGRWGAPYGYWLLIVAGVGIFCGCVGKSAQFPLHVWLPDAMEGPTPVSALVHSATMVAAGVYLVGRFFPVFLPEVLLVIAAAGGITLFLAATIAITATDIKRVLAYSTVSQLGYMMLSLGLGGWLAGLMHLITHAFFKSLLFMCSGSVIHAVHTNEMTAMGGLRKKMPITAYTMLIGCMAIAGAGLPFILLGRSVGFSGFYSKDRILEQAFSFMSVNGGLGTLFFLTAAGGAAITAFYMFRLWYLTFAGQPRDLERYEHAHESPRIMYLPLIVLSVFAIAVAWHPLEALAVGVAGLVATGLLYVTWNAKGLLAPAAAHAAHGHAHDAPAHDSHGHDAHGHDSHGHDDHGHGHDSHGHDHGPPMTHRGFLGLLAFASVVLLVLSTLWTSAGMESYALEEMLEQARPDGTLVDARGAITSLVWPDEHKSHAYAVPVTILASGTALAGFILATLMYGLRRLNPDEVRRQFQPVYTLLRNKWWFDELYDWVFVRPVHVAARFFAMLDKKLLDGLIHAIARGVRWFATFWERLADRNIVDGLVNSLAAGTKSLGLRLRAVQTGSLRQYVMFIVIGAVVIFLLISFYWNPAVVAG